MKVNIFKIPKDKVKDLKDKLKSVGLESINGKVQKTWNTEFFFSLDVDPVVPTWIETYLDFFPSALPSNRIYSACYFWENAENCFALSYGKSHFYLRQFCDHDFGTYIAKRIANEKDVRQKSSKKFAGKKKKEIKSYTKNSRLDIESGESVDYLQASIIANQRVNFGKAGKFGSSVLLSPAIKKEELPDLFDNLLAASLLSEQFPLPRTTIINNTVEAAKYEDILLTEILTQSDSSDFTENSHDLVGVDFIFSGNEKYRFSHKGKESELFEDLSLEKLNEYITKHSIPRNEIFAIKVVIEKEDARPYTRYVKESLDYIVDDANIILSQGNWMSFNEDYLLQLDEYIDVIEIEPTEGVLVDLEHKVEGELNKFFVSHGYANADKDFSKIKVESGVAVEAWDLEKGDTVYAVKIGTLQKVGYVCDQANNTLELIKKKSNLRTLSSTFKVYCLWIVLERKTRISKLSELKSIIFKQKIESWARKCSEYGIIPKVKISYTD